MLILFTISLSAECVQGFCFPVLFSFIIVTLGRKTKFLISLYFYWLLNKKSAIDINFRNCMGNLNTSTMRNEIRGHHKSSELLSVFLFYFHFGSLMNLINTTKKQNNFIWTGRLSPSAHKAAPVVALKQVFSGARRPRNAVWTSAFSGGSQVATTSVKFRAAFLSVCLLFGRLSIPVQDRLIVWYRGWARFSDLILSTLRVRWQTFTEVLLALWPCQSCDPSADDIRKVKIEILADGGDNEETVFYFRKENGIRGTIMNWRNLIKDGRAIIPNSVTEICGNAFNGCSGLAGIEIPDSMRKIGKEAFLCIHRIKGHIHQY